VTKGGRSGVVGAAREVPATGTMGGRRRDHGMSTSSAGTGDQRWRIDDLAHRAGVTVDTIRFYQREGLLPPAERAGRTKVYGAAHIERLQRIRELQERRFSLAAIRALLDADRPGMIDGIFGSSSAAYDFDTLVERSGMEPELAVRLRDAGLLRDPEDFGRDAYDSADLDVVRAAAELRRFGMPADIVVELVSIYAVGVEEMQTKVVELFRGERGPAWKPGELEAFQETTTASAANLLPVATRIVEYVHERTLRRLTLAAVERANVRSPRDTEVDESGEIPAVEG
jgi:DNA-binding transcriptional MerR regulator